MENSNLTSMEKSFLQLTQVKNVIDITKIKNLFTSISTNEKRSFKKRLEVAQQMNTIKTWFKSADGKQTMTEHGIDWKIKDLAERVISLSESQFSKYAKMGERATDERVNAFLEEQEIILNEGKTPSYSVEEFNRFANEETRRENGEEIVRTAQSQSVITLTAKNLEGLTKAFTIRIKDDGTLKTNADVQTWEIVKKFVSEAMKKEAERMEELAREVAEEDAQN